MKTIVSAAFVGVALASQGNVNGSKLRHDNQLGFKSDMDKAGNFYDKHSGAIDGAVTTAATVGKLFANQNDNQLDFQSDMANAGNFYSNHQGAIDGAVTTAATVAKILADQNELDIRNANIINDEFDIRNANIINDEFDIRNVNIVNDDALDIRNANIINDEFDIRNVNIVNDELDMRNVNIINDDAFDFQSDMANAGNFYSNHQGAIDGAVTTAATVAKILADQNELDIRNANIINDEFDIRNVNIVNDDALDIRNVNIVNDELDMRNVNIINDDAFDFKSDMDKAGNFYSDHTGAIDGAVTTAAKVAKILADQNDNEYGIKQRAEFVAKHGRTIAKIASLFGDQNDNQLDFQSDMDKVGSFVDQHQKAIETGAKIAGAVAMVAADGNDDDFDVNSHLARKNNLASLKGLENRNNKVASKKFLSW